MHWTHPSGARYTIDYVIPNTNQCKDCHNRSKAVVPIGPKARNLNKDFSYAEGRANQLAYWTRIGYLKGAPPPENAPREAVWDDPSTGAVDARARAYLDANCGHCHNPQGSANTSGLYLTALQADPMRLRGCGAHSRMDHLDARQLRGIEGRRAVRRAGGVTGPGYVASTDGPVVIPFAVAASTAACPRHVLPHRHLK